MLVLSRQRDEEIVILDPSGAELGRFTIVDIRGDKVRVGVTMPKSIGVHRKEVWDNIRREAREAEARHVEANRKHPEKANARLSQKGTP